MIVSFLNQKGGVGKTTLSVNLSRAFALENKSTLLVDSDPQKSARDWHSRSEGEILNVIGIDVPTIDKDIKKMDLLYDWIFIDGAGRLSPISAKTILCSDIVIIPLQPSPYDVWGSEYLISLVEQRIEISRGKFKAAFVISNQKPNTNLSKEIREVLKTFESIPILKAGTYNRVVYSDCASEGKTVFEMTRSGSEDAQREIINIKEEIKEIAYELAQTQGQSCAQATA